MKIEREIYTRNDVVLLLLDWLRPLKEHYSQGAARLVIGDTASHYSERAAHMEGYARVLWGLGPLFASKNQALSPAVLSEIASWKKLVRCGLVNGTDPAHEEYWGEIGDYDQRMVEMTAIVNALLLSPDTLWEPLTSAQGRRLLEKPNMIAVHEKSGHTLLYPAGQHAYNFGNVQAKYQKFVYSNQFGFSVQRGSGLEDGAFDNTLAVTAADEHAWHMRNGEGRYEVTAQYIMMEYRLVRGVAVETVIVPLKKGHVRIHFIQADIEAEYADGGFAIRTEREGQEMTPEMTCTAGGRACCVFPWGTAGAVCLKGAGEARIVKAFPNTNLMYGSTVIPTVCYRMGAGTYWIADYFYGDEANRDITNRDITNRDKANENEYSGSGNSKDSVELPQIICQSEAVQIVYQSERITVSRAVSISR